MPRTFEEIRRRRLERASVVGSTVLSLSVAQYRMLGRILRGERLPYSRYQGPTIFALERKGCVELSSILTHRGLHWTATSGGRDVFAARGKLRRKLV